MARFRLSASDLYGRSIGEYLPLYQGRRVLLRCQPLGKAQRSAWRELALKIGRTGSLQSSWTALLETSASPGRHHLPKHSPMSMMAEKVMNQLARANQLKKRLITDLSKP